MPPSLPYLEDLFPALLAHLPAAHTSSKPPLSLFPLLAPILRQRLQILSGPSLCGSWLALLTWSSTKGSELLAHISSNDLSPHPSSGEVEVGRVKLLGLKRVDEETFNACGELCDWGIVVVYTWEIDDPDDGPDGWKVMDVHPRSCMEDIIWYPTVDAAEQAFSSKTLDNLTKTAAEPVNCVQPSENLSDDVDDYWSMYDRSASQTPAAQQKQSLNEDSYFDQYYGEVIGEDKMDKEMNTQINSHIRSIQTSKSTTTNSTPPTAVSTSPRPYAPLPISLKSNCIKISHLEASVDHRVHSEVATKQHISTSLKSLYRLARATGIDREEFESLIQTEIAVLAMMDTDDSY